MIKAPFPWFGGKSRAAPLVWQALGDVKNYVEPFAGSLAVLLGRPHAPHVETVNDLDCYLANFWRAVQADPEAVARWADAPVNEADLHARHAWLRDQEAFRERMKTDPDFFDVKIAGWWAWGLCAWIGRGWCSSAWRQLPNVDGLGGKGLHSASLRDGGVADLLRALSLRLKHTRVTSGDWSRVLTSTVLRTSPVTPWRHATGVFLDPPYTDGKMSYAVGGGVSDKVREWAIANGDRADLRIVLCGYEGEHAMPDTWRVVEWKARGGYGKTAAALANAHRERLWLSPACLDVDEQMPSEDGPEAA